MKEFVFSESWYWFLIAATVCYFIGCFNFAILISDIKKRDIRSEGSGNPGTMNMTRTFGLKIGVLNFLCELIKGGVPALAGYFLFKDYCFAGTDVAVADFARYFFGMFVVVGHIFPVTLKFKGGKGIAATMGLYVFSLPCERWWFIFIAVAVLICVFLYIAFTEWGSMGSLMGVAGFTIWQAAMFVVKYSDNLLNGWVISILAVLLLINILTWTAHRKNLFKLLAGEEHRTSVRKHKDRNF